MSKRKDQQKKEDAQLPVVHTNAAGIDLGSKFHLVSIGQDLQSQVRRFGVYTDDLQELANWLIEHGIVTVAMESTGVYWKSLWRILQDYGLEVVLVNKSWKREKKTDVEDCMWLQQLHTLGLLQGSFLATNETEQLKHLWRHRQNLMRDGGHYVRRMQKAMRLMNICLDQVLSNVVGASGRAIVEAILEGQRDPSALADLASKRIKKSRAEVAKALHGDWREEHLFELKQCYEMYQILVQKRLECDHKIEEVLTQRIAQNEGQQQLLEDKDGVKKKVKNKNDLKFNIQQMSYALFNGIDLSAVDGVSHGLLMNFLAEVGTDVKAFPKASSFAAWLRLSPNNRKSGGKKISSRAQRSTNPLTQAFKNSANAIGRHKKGALGSFFHRMAYKKGWKAAVTATAHKLAIIIWNMIHKNEPFQYFENEQYLQKLKEQKIKIINKQIARWGLDPDELCFDKISTGA